MAKYFEEVPYIGEFDVVFIIKETGVKLVEQFSSPYLARKFVLKCRKSDRVELVAYPIF